MKVQPIKIIHNLLNDSIEVDRRKILFRILREVTYDILKS